MGTPRDSRGFSRGAPAGPTPRSSKCRDPASQRAPEREPDGSRRSWGAPGCSGPLNVGGWGSSPSEGLQGDSQGSSRGGWGGQGVRHPVVPPGLRGQASRGAPKGLPGDLRGLPRESLGGSRGPPGGPTPTPLLTFSFGRSNLPKCSQRAPRGAPKGSQRRMLPMTPQICKITTPGGLSGGSLGSSRGHPGGLRPPVTSQRWWAKPPRGPPKGP